MLTLQVACERHRTGLEGPLFSALLIVAGVSGQALKATNTDKRQELIWRLRERISARRGYIVVLFCDCNSEPEAAPLVTHPRSFPERRGGDEVNMAASTRDHAKLERCLHG